MNLKPTCYWQQRAQAGQLGQGSSGCAPAEQWTGWAARLNQTHCHSHAAPAFSASLGCGQKLCKLPVQPMSRGAWGRGMPSQTLLLSHPAWPLCSSYGGVPAGARTCGVGAFAGCDPPSSPGCPPPAPVSPHSRGGRAGHPQAWVGTSLRCQQKSVCVCVRVVSVPIMLPGKVSP